MKDMQVVSSLVQLKALVAGLYGRIDELAGASTGPAVDFIVDLFDRADSSDLGVYWGYSQDFSVASGRAVATGTTPAVAVSGNTSYSYDAYSTCSLDVNQNLPQSYLTPAGVMQDYAGQYLQGAYGSAESVLPTITGSINFLNYTVSRQSYPRGVGKMAALYSASLSGDNVIVRITFDVTADTDAAERMEHLSANHYEATRVEINHPTSFGIAIGTAAVCGYSFLQAASPANGGYYMTGIPDGPWYMDPAIIIPAQLSNLSFGGMSPGGTLLETVQKAVTDEIELHYLGNYLSASYPRSSLRRTDVLGGDTAVVVGNNTLEIASFIGGYIITLNGSVLFNAATPLAASRDRVGLASLVGDALAAAANIGVEPTGITSFKAWRSDIPEPPNESGHGTVVSGQFTYADKYHTPTGSGYIYNPEA